MSTATFPTTTFPFTQTFATLSETIDALALDIRYNPEVARQSARWADRSDDLRAVFTTGEVDDRGETKVFIVTHCNLDDCLVVTRWNPFYGCLDDSALYLYRPVNAAGAHCKLSGAVAIERLDDLRIPNDKKSRRSVAKLGFLVGKV
jgi:hypothetical protein